MATATHKSTTRDIPRLDLRAEVMLETLDVEKRTVEITWTTGARVLRGFFDQFLEELSLDPKHVRMERLNSGAPLLDDHNRDGTRSVIGVVESARLEKKRGSAKVRFDTGVEGDEVFRKVRERILRHVSVGYATYKMVKVEDGSTTIPVYRAIDWEPFELSVTPIGADTGAGFRAQTNDSNPCEFVTSEENVMADETETPKAPAKPVESAAVAATRAATLARGEAAKAIAEAKAEAAGEAVEQERARAAGIRSLAKQSKLGEAWASKLIEGGVSVDDARAAAWDQVVANDDEYSPDGSVRISAGDDAREKFCRGASAWMLERTGMRALVEAAAKKNPEAFKGISFDPGEFRGYSPVELARLSLERQGVKTRGLDKMELLGLAFTHRSASGTYQTTSDFANMLENVLGKVLLGAYETQETTYDQICGTETVPDFRSSNRYRTGSVESLDSIQEGGEYKNGKIPDAGKYAISTERKGKIFSLSREVLMNDDMGAITNLAQEFGRASARTLENGFYALLAQNAGLGPTMADTQPYFHANRANVNATGSALTVTGLDADRVVMRAQKDPSGLDFLTISPKILLVPDSLWGTARVLNDSAKDPDANNKLERKNIAFGMFDNIIGTPRLSSSSTRRYLFATPTQVAAFVVAYLEGYGRGPRLESQQGWRTDGVEWRVTLYAKVQPGDPKGALTNAGG